MDRSFTKSRRNLRSEAPNGEATWQSRSFLVGQSWFGIELQVWRILREISLDPINCGLKTAHLLFYLRPIPFYETWV